MSNTINPFDIEYDSFVHLTSGSVASSKVESSIKKFNLQTFAFLVKKVSGKKKNGYVVELKNLKELFAKMILIANNIRFDPFPLSLGTLEGNLVKSTKSKLFNEIKKELQDGLVETIDGEKALVIDAMALLQ